MATINLGRVAYVNRGAYSSITTYEKHDVVTYNNGSYVFIGATATAGKPPTDSVYWAPMLDPTLMNAATDRANAAATSAEAASASIQSDLASKATAIIKDASGEIITITDGAEAMPVKSLTTHIEPVQEGEGDPSPDNVRPISGWDKVRAQRASKNLTPYPYHRPSGYKQAGITYTVNNDGSITANGTATATSYFALEASTNPIYFYPGVYTMGGVPAGDFGGNQPLQFWFSNASGGNSFGVLPGGRTFTLANGTYFGISVCVPQGNTLDNVTFYPMLVAGEAILPFESPTTSQTLTADLPETVYGGTLDWWTGKLYKTFHRIVFDGVTVGAKMDTTDRTGATYAYIHQDNMSKRLLSGSEPHSNMLKRGQIGASVSTSKVLALSLSSDLTGVTSTDDKNTITAKYNAVLKQWYDAGTPLEVVYEMETPEEIQLTPQQLSTLKGTNNIWSDAGQTEVTYAADTETWGKNAATSMLGATENGMTATKNYSIGDFIIIKDALTMYRATAAIANGETIIPGTNCMATTIVEQLTAIYGLLNA